LISGDRHLYHYEEEEEVVKHKNITTLHLSPPMSLMMRRKPGCLEKNNIKSKKGRKFWPPISSFEWQ
jgi:hypothetical protein